MFQGMTACLAHDTDYGSCVPLAQLLAQYLHIRISVIAAPYSAHLTGIIVRILSIIHSVISTAIAAHPISRSLHGFVRSSILLLLPMFHRLCNICRPWVAARGGMSVPLKRDRVPVFPRASACFRAQRALCCQMHGPIHLRARAMPSSIDPRTVQMYSVS